MDSRIAGRASCAKHPEWHNWHIGAAIPRGRIFLSPNAVQAASTQQWHHRDSVTGLDFRVGVGLLLHCSMSDFGRDGNVGSAGAGGATVFADPQNHLTFAYTPTDTQAATA